MLELSIDLFIEESTFIRLFRELREISRRAKSIFWGGGVWPLPFLLYFLRPIMLLGAFSPLFSEATLEEFCLFSSIFWGYNTVDVPFLLYFLRSIIKGDGLFSSIFWGRLKADLPFLLYFLRWKLTSTAFSPLFSEEKATAKRLFSSIFWGWKLKQWPFLLYFLRPKSAH